MPQESRETLIDAGKEVGLEAEVVYVNVPSPKRRAKW
jgi:hypothetical protein